MFQHVMHSPMLQPQLLESRVATALIWLEEQQSLPPFELCVDAMKVAKCDVMVKRNGKVRERPWGLCCETGES